METPDREVLPAVSRRPTTPALRGALALGLSVVLATGGALPGVRTARAQDASPVASGAASEGVVPSFARPTAADLDAASGLTVVDTLAPAPAGTQDASSFADDAWAVAESLSEESADLDALAASLGDDPDAAFRFVRDRIGFEPYAGILRGARGTLAARSGNAADRSLLLAALLDRMGRSTRFVRADLDETTAQRLVDRALEPPVEPLAADPGLALEPLDPDAIVQRARRDYALLLRALGDRVDTLRDLGPATAVAEAARHVWVQVEDGGQWRDLDPTLPDADPGEALGQATETLDVLPDSLSQGVTFEVVRETLADGVLVTDTLLSQRLDAEAAADSDVYLTFVRVPDPGSGDLFGGGAATADFVPVLLVGDGFTAGTQFPTIDTVDESGGLGFGGMGGGGGESALASLRLRVTLDAPGLEPVTADRPIVDRVPAADRVVGTTSADRLSVMALREDVPEPLTWIHHVMVSNGGADTIDRIREQAAAAALFQNEVAGDELADLPLQALLWPQAITDRGLVVASERVIVPALDDAVGTHAVIDRPRVFVASLGPDPTAPGAVAQRTDLLIDGVRVLGPGDEALRARIWYGALMSALETEQGLLKARGADPARAHARSASLAMTGPLGVIGAGDASGLATDAPAAQREALADGGLLVVPAGATPADVWWEIGADGSTRAMLQPAMGGWEIFPGTGKASIYHFNPGGGGGRGPDRGAPKTQKTRARPGDEYALLIGGIAIPGQVAVTWLGTAGAFLLAYALDYLLNGGDGFSFRRHRR
jgi:transglutaminase-like putative cysteine protease